MTTLLQLRTRARQRADMVGSQFVTDPELTSLINSGYAELYDLVVSAYEDYFSILLPFTVTSGDTYALPANFYKLRGLDFNNGGSWLACREFNFTDRNNTQYNFNYLNTPTAKRSYRIMGDNLLLQPTQAAAGDYRLWYAPAPTALFSDADTLPSSLSKFGWDEYVVLYAVERMLSKEETSVTDVVRERSEIVSRISKMAQDRQVEQSSTIQDVQGSHLDSWGWRHDY